MKRQGNITSLTPRVGGFLFICLVLVSAGSAMGADAFVIIGDGEATDISADGTVIVGVTSDTNETWRWTQKAGRLPLERSSDAANEMEWGTPDVSDDGRVISATILSPASGFPSLAFWTEKTGWMTPPADFGNPQAGAPGGQSLAWGLSGDGSTLVGQIRIAADQTRAVAWNPEKGMVQLGERGRNSRANDTNTDGTVTVGWSENPSTGIWQPTVWNGTRPVVLASTKAFCEAMAVTANGMIIVGQAYDESRDQREAALWLDSDFGWVQESLGVLPGTLASYGQAMALDLTDNGHTIVGFNSFDPNRSTGFIWTLDGGLESVHDYLEDRGVMLPEGFQINSVTGISDDGRFMSGFGQDTTFWPHQTRSFLIDGEAFPREKPRKKILPAGMDIPNPFKTKNLE